MTMMNSFSPADKAGKKEYYLGIILREKEGCLLVLELDRAHQQVHQIDERPFECLEGWEHIVESIDEVLFQLEQDHNYSFKEVIFFLYAHLVDQQNKKIKQAYLEKIKKITQELELTPLGYIDYQEALSIYLGDKEARPFTAVVVEIDILQLSLFVYKGGSLVLSETRERNQTASLTADLELLFATMKGKTVVPTRVLIYDSAKLEEEINTVMTQKWPEEVFVQIPKFEIIPETPLKTALLFAFAQQLFEESAPVKETVKEETQEVMGFVIGKDIQSEVKTTEKPERKKVNIVGNLMKNVIHKLRGRWLIPIGVAVVIAGAAVFSSLYFLHKAEVTVYLQGKLVENQLEIKGQTDGGDQNVLKMAKVEQTAEKSATASTTGKKTIGEKARGEITIYNSGKAEKTFKKNTIFTAKGIKFELDDEVKVASASESLTSEGNLLTVTGKVKASLTAKDIGSEANLDKTEKLQIEDFPLTLYFALPINSFTGGNKRDVQTVAKDDLAKLKESVLKQMKQEADKLIKEKIATAQIIDKLTAVKLTDEQYTKELGEEAKSVSLTAKGKVTLVTYAEVDLKKIILKQAADFIPDNYELPSEAVSYSVADAKEKDQVTTLTVKISAKTIRKLDKNQLIAESTGKTVQGAESLTREQFKVQGYKAKVQTPLPFLRSRLPFFGKNISVRVESL